MTPLPSARALDQYFLEARSRLLDVAAFLDRLDRGGDVPADPRLDRIRAALDVLRGDDPDRAAQVQRIFSLDYDAAWPRPQPRL